MKLAKIFFDFDGTLLDTWLRSYAAYEFAVTNLHGTIISFQEFVSFKKNGIGDEKLLIESGLSESSADSYNKFINDSIEEPSFMLYDTLFDWVKPFLGFLNHYFYLFLLTSRRNPKYCERQIEKLQIGHLFDKIFIVRDKFEVLKDYASEHLIIVTDNESDIVLGNKGKWTTVAVTWGHRNSSVLEKYKPTYIINTPQSLFLLLSWPLK